MGREPGVEPVLAVISAGNGCSPSHAGPLDALLSEDAVMISRVGGFSAEPVVTDCSSTDSLIDCFASLPDRFAAVFLARTDIELAGAVIEGCAERDVRPVLAEVDATAAAACAKTFVYLHQAGRDVARRGGRRTCSPVLHVAAFPHRPPDDARRIGYDPVGQRERSPVPTG